MLLRNSVKELIDQNISINQRKALMTHGTGLKKKKKEREKERKAIDFFFKNVLKETKNQIFATTTATSRNNGKLNALER